MANSESDFKNVLLELARSDLLSSLDFLARVTAWLALSLEDELLHKACATTEQLLEIEQSISKRLE